MHSVGKMVRHGDGIAKDDIFERRWSVAKCNEVTAKHRSVEHGNGRAIGDV